MECSEDVWYQNTSGLQANDRFFCCIHQIRLFFWHTWVNEGEINPEDDHLIKKLYQTEELFLSKCL